MNRFGPMDYMSAYGQNSNQAQYKDFEATELYCMNCGKAVPVIKSLLLVLPEGDKYEYRCKYCGTSVGDKIDKHGQYQTILKR